MYPARQPSDPLTDFTLALARRAGTLMTEFREQRRLQLDYKDHHELVTSADLAVDRLINQAIQEQYPQHGRLTEESAATIDLSQWDGQPLWIVDPIDGTVNYAHGHQQVAVSIAYAEAGEVRLGVVHCPFQQETFVAIRGQGAWLNGQPIAVSGRQKLQSALIATGFPYARDQLDLLLARLRNILGHCQDIRRIGSAAVDICWVAAGRLDAYYETVKPWDSAAAALIAREAGATVGHLGAVPDALPAELYSEDLVIATPALYEPLRQLLWEADQI